MNRVIKGVFAISALQLVGGLGLISCEKTNRSFSILQAEQVFQTQAVYKPRKIDILWVVDNSGSMASSQANLTANFRSFVAKFESLNYDFRMAVTTTEAWRGKYSQIGATVIDKEKMLRWQVGDPNVSPVVRIIDRETAGLDQVFVKNATTGITGSGDERAFESLEAALKYSANQDFRRSDAYLAVIVVSDEDDFSVVYNSENPSLSSASTIGTYRQYTSPNIVPVTYYKSYLDGVAGAGNYSVNSIAIFDSACQQFLNSQISGRLIAKRYAELSDLTQGRKVSLCGDFASQLSLISDTIIEGAATFVLDREPIEETLQVVNSGRVVPRDSQNGWSYEAGTRTVRFHGSEVPTFGASIVITFDPTSQSF
jgi:hypothetical protein